MIQFIMRPSFIKFTFLKHGTAYFFRDDLFIIDRAYILYIMAMQQGIKE